MRAFAGEVDPNWQQWRDAVREPVVDAALRDLYRELDEQVAARGPTCWVSGKCCKFREYEHRLYVTGLEIAWFMEQVQRAPTASESGSGNLRLPLLDDPTGACPYQIDGLCSTHAIRPLGCRVFFCQHGTQDWQQDLYEQFLRRLRTLHDEQGLPYRYMEWLAGLREGMADF